jgi:hypothetical protein
MARRANIIGRERVVNCQLCRLCNVPVVTEDAVIVCKEHGENRCRNVESWGKYNAHISDSHLVDIRVVNNFEQELGQSSQQCQIGPWQSMHQRIEGCYLLLTVIKF